MRLYSKRCFDSTVIARTVNKVNRTKQADDSEIASLLPAGRQERSNL
jgi:hypothetical protein